MAFDDLPEQALLIVDSASIIYFLENHPKLAPHFEPLFAAHGAPEVRGDDEHDCRSAHRPPATGDEAVARRYRATLDGWQVVELNVDIAESAARLRALARPFAAGHFRNQSGFVRFDKCAVLSRLEYDRYGYVPGKSDEFRPNRRAKNYLLTRCGICTGSRARSVAQLMAKQGLMDIALPEREVGRRAAVIAIEQVAAVSPRSETLLDTGG